MSRTPRFRPSRAVLVAGSSSPARSRWPAAAPVRSPRPPTRSPRSTAPTRDDGRHRRPRRADRLPGEPAARSGRRVPGGRRGAAEMSIVNQSTERRPPGLGQQPDRRVGRGRRATTDAARGHRAAHRRRVEPGRAAAPAGRPSRPRSRRSARPTRARPRHPPRGPSSPPAPRRRVGLREWRGSPPQGCQPAHPAAERRRRAPRLERQVELTGLREDIRAGLTYPIGLTFERAGQVTVMLPVGTPAIPARRPSRSDGPRSRAARAGYRCAECGHQSAQWVGRCPVVPGLGHARADRGRRAGPAHRSSRRAHPARRPGGSPTSSSTPPAPARPASPSWTGCSAAGSSPARSCCSPVSRASGSRRCCWRWPRRPPTRAGALRHRRGVGRAGPAACRAHRLPCTTTLYLAAESDLASMLRRTSTTLAPQLLVVDSIQTMSTATRRRRSPVGSPRPAP